MLVEIVAVHQPAYEVGVLRVVLGRVDIADVKVVPPVMPSSLTCAHAEVPSQLSIRRRVKNLVIGWKNGTERRSVHEVGAKLVVRAER